jgi:transcriptional regulator with XRE-family HTH domain
MGEDRDYQRLLRTIAANIRRLRHASELTQEDMMDLGFNYRFFQKLESGRYSPNLRTLHRLARAFKVGIGEFFQ